MSEPIPESIPTSADPRSRRPIKRARGANAVTAEQANAIDRLFLDPEREIKVPPTSAESKHTLAPPPEIVANVQGSSAGAGSGEFHVYKASRRREYERLRTMDEEAKKEEEEAEWDRKEREKKEKDEEATRKKREKRQKRKGKKGVGEKEGMEVEGVKDHGKGTNGVKKPLNIPKGSDKDENHAENLTGVAEVVQENGITIRDDD